MPKYVYSFGKTKTDGKADMKNLLGGKGANLAEMSRLGIPVPSGFTITTDCCNDFLGNNGKFPSGMKGEVKKALEIVGQYEPAVLQAGAPEETEEMAEEEV